MILLTSICPECLSANGANRITRLSANCSKTAIARFKCQLAGTVLYNQNEVKPSSGGHAPYICAWPGARHFNQCQAIGWHPDLHCGPDRPPNEVLHSLSQTNSGCHTQTTQTTLFELTYNSVACCYLQCSVVRYAATLSNVANHLGSAHCATSPRTTSRGLCYSGSTKTLEIPGACAAIL